MFEESSHALFEALGGRVYIKSVSVVVPSTWRDGKCQRVINTPRGVDAPYRDADIVVAGTHPVHGDSPYTQQSKGWSWMDKRSKFLGIRALRTEGGVKNIPTQSNRTQIL